MADVKFNVLFITHTSSKYTGSNKSLLGMIEGLKARGVNPFVVIPKRNNMSIVEELNRLKVKFFVHTYYIPRYPNRESLKNRILFFPKLLRAKLSNRLVIGKIKEICAQNQINIIHTNVGPLLIGKELASQIGLPHVWHIREFQDLDFNMDTWYSKQEFQMFLNAENTFPVAISKAVSDHFSIGDTGCIIYNGIMKESEAVFIPLKEKYFLFAGYLRESKGIKDLILAFGDFAKNHPEYRLKIAGDTTDSKFRNELFDLVKELRLGGSVEFLGRRDDVPVLMSKATALVVPSHHEAFGRITAEALFSGCFVIGRNTGGTKEIIDKMRVGILYNNHGELVKALGDVVSNIHQYSLEVQDALEEVKIQFSIEGNSSSILSLYRKIQSK